MAEETADSPRAFRRYRGYEGRRNDDEEVMSLDEVTLIAVAGGVGFGEGRAFRCLRS
jgi:hypothetical protein